MTQEDNERLETIERRIEELEKRIEALESIQVTRQEFDELKARVEMIEIAQRSLAKGMAQFIVSV